MNMIVSTVSTTRSHSPCMPRTLYFPVANETLALQGIDARNVDDSLAGSNNLPRRGYSFMATALSAPEVAALVDLDEGRIRKDVEHGLFDSPRFFLTDLVYFRIVALLG